MNIVTRFSVPQGLPNWVGPFGVIQRVKVMLPELTLGIFHESDWKTLSSEKHVKMQDSLVTSIEIPRCYLPGLEFWIQE